MDLSWLPPVIPALQCCDACPVFLGLRKVKRGSRKQGCKLLRSSRKIMTSLFFQTLWNLKVLEPFSSYLFHGEKCVFLIALDVIMFLAFYSAGIYRHGNCFEIVFLLLQTWLVGREWELEIFITSAGSISRPPFKYLPLLFFFNLKSLCEVHVIHWNRSTWGSWNSAFLWSNLFQQKKRLWNF